MRFPINDPARRLEVYFLYTTSSILELVILHWHGDNRNIPTLRLSQQLIEKLLRGQIPTGTTLKKQP